MITTSKASGGFTLLEVMIALLIFVLSAAAVLSLFAVGTSAHRRAIEQSDIALLSGALLAQAQERIDAGNPKPVQDGVMEAQGLPYRYDLEFEPFDPQDPKRAAYIVRLRIRWGEGARSTSENFETLLLRRPKR